MIRKKLGKITFGWDPNAMSGKGYWYVTGKDDSYARAATRMEASKLGRPKEGESPAKGASKYFYGVSKSGKPTRKRFRSSAPGAEGEPSEYEVADAIRSKSLAQLASERMMSGQGLGKSIKGALSESIKAKGTNIKKKFDPMNLLSKISPLAATAYGMKRGRSKEDISYFTGLYGRPELEAKKLDQEGEAPTEKKSASKLGGGGGLGFGAKGALNNIYKLLEDKFEEDKKLRETQEGFKEEEKTEAERRHNELIDAILKGMKPKEKKEKKEDKKGLLGILMGALASLGSMFGNFFGKFSGLATSILKNLALVAGKLGLKLLDLGKSAVKGGFNLAKKGGELVKSGYSAVKGALGFGKDAAKTTATTGSTAAKGASTTVKTAKTAEKVGETAAKTAKTATKVSGASKLLKGGSKLFGFLKSVPGLGAIAAGADLIMRISDINRKLEAKEITDAEYKKEIVKAIGAAAAAGALPVLGAAVGSVIPGVGTLVGGLAGGAAALLGGDEIGAWLGGKMYDFFVNDKKPTASHAGQKTASPVSSASASPAGAKTSTAPSSSSGVPTASASAAGSAPSQLGQRANAATMENQNLVGPATQAGAPVVVNKTTNVVNNGGSSGGGGSGSLRNDEPVLTRLQYQSVRPV